MDERQFGGQRKEIRYVVNREFASLEEFITEYVDNVSRSGAFIRSDDPLPVGTRVALKFSIIADEIEIIEGEGKVVRVVEPGSERPAGMGVTFTALSPESEQLLEQMLRGRR